ncbi:MAG: hypothetical protein GF311_06120 [Candidatus Lokiarchaeota archaeon]|nr:hypothetical protein [Candidatus Lokiarchaeota archaeon]
MSEELKRKIEIINKYFEGFSNYIELQDLRDFLLFTLNSQISSNILAQLGMGGKQEVINLPFNPVFNIYYQKINLISAGNLIVYCKTESISDKFIIEKNDPVLKNYLNELEKDLAFRTREKFIIPKISDCTPFQEDENEVLALKIDDLYHDLKSFMAVTEPNILFVIDGPQESDPDLLFAFNMMPEMPGKTDKKVLRMDVYLDPEHKTRDIKYLKREEDYRLTFLHEIKEIGHSELFKSSFSLIIHIKSFEKPF